MKWCPEALLALVVLLAGCHQGPPPDELVAGRFFPPLVMQRLADAGAHGVDTGGADAGGAGKPLSDYRGRLVVLNVWATWCPPCRKELPSLQRLSERLDPARFAVIGLSVDSDADFAREYLLERGIAFDTFIDPGAGEVRRLLGVRAYPDTFIISPDGVLLRGVVGDRAWDDPAISAALETAFSGDLAGLKKI